MIKRVSKNWPVLALFVISTGFVNTAMADCDDKREPGVDWSGCNKMHKLLDDQDFTGSRFDGANLSLSKLDKSIFTRASLVKADLTRSSLDGATFTQSVLIKSVGWLSFEF